MPAPIPLGPCSCARSLNRNSAPTKAGAHHTENWTTGSPWSSALRTYHPIHGRPLAPVAFHRRAPFSIKFCPKRCMVRRKWRPTAPTMNFSERRIIDRSERTILIELQVSAGARPLRKSLAVEYGIWFLKYWPGLSDTRSCDNIRLKLLPLPPVDLP